MKTTALLVLASLALIAAMAFAPHCRPGEHGPRIGGAILIAGCP
jgi:hypothetical protein